MIEKPAGVPATRRGAIVLGSFIDELNWQDAIRRISDWATHHESRSVYCCNVHSVVTAAADPQFQKILASADMTTADGAPIAWMMRRLGFPEQERISGPDLMWKYCAATTALKGSIFLYGSSVETLAALQERLQNAFPSLNIAGAISPPYRTLTPEEEQQNVEIMNASGASVVFVSLGCPKQERWIAQHRGSIHAVMIGVGAAFDYHGGSLRRAPAWAGKAGLEWLYRLGMEPRRLWKRYLVTNSIFLVRAVKQLLCRDEFPNGQKRPAEQAIRSKDS